MFESAGAEVFVLGYFVTSWNSCFVLCLDASLLKLINTFVLERPCLELLRLGSGQKKASLQQKLTNQTGT